MNKMECLTPGNEHKKGTFLAKRKLLYFPGEVLRSFSRFLILFQPVCDSALVCTKCNLSVAKEHDIINWVCIVGEFIYM